MFISIHALREEGDGSDLHQSTLVGLFQSTPSARRATPFMFHSTSKPLYFNPRPPRGGRQRANVVGGRTQEFQSTPSARRATRTSRLRPVPARNFNPRPPRGGRPCSSKPALCFFHISIHALREEGDLFSRLYLSIKALFQSTPSARRATVRVSPPDASVPNFNPRPPRGGRLYGYAKLRRFHAISIHALREEGDQ